MIKYDSCIRCTSKNIDRLTVSSNTVLYYPEIIQNGSKRQRQIIPTNALVCKDCGHIEFVFDWEKSNH